WTTPRPRALLARVTCTGPGVTPSGTPFACPSSSLLPRPWTLTPRSGREGAQEDRMYTTRSGLEYTDLKKGTGMNVEIGAGQKGKKLPPDQVERRLQTARQLGLRPTGRWKGREWTKQQLRLLGKFPDAELAERFGRTVNAVRVQRTKRGIAKTEDG